MVRPDGVVVGSRVKNNLPRGFDSQTSIIRSNRWNYSKHLASDNLPTADVEAAGNLMIKLNPVNSQTLIIIIIVIIIILANRRCDRSAESCEHTRDELTAAGSSQLMARVSPICRYIGIHHSPALICILYRSNNRPNWIHQLSLNHSPQHNRLRSTDWRHIAYTCTSLDTAGAVSSSEQWPITAHLRRRCHWRQPLIGCCCRPPQLMMTTLGKRCRNGCVAASSLTKERCKILEGYQHLASSVEILKGNPKYMEASLTQGHAHFSSGCGFMVVLGKPQAVPNLKSLASATA